MSGMGQLDHRSLLVLAARRFYLEDCSKVDIAKELGVSRFKVARLLEQAREDGVVSITLNDEGTQDADLAERLRQRLDLHEAVVIETYGNEDAGRRRVGEAAAQLLADTLHTGEVLGLAWGRTLSKMTEALPQLPAVSVVQLTGAIGSHLESSPVEIIRKVAVSSGGTASPIYSPLILEDQATAASLLRQPDVAKAFSMFDTVTTAVVSVGSWVPPNTQMMPALPRSEQVALLQEGVRADLAAILVDAEGEVVPSELAKRCIGISPDQLRAVPRILGVAAGADKAAAIEAVARGELITGIVTDRALAEAVLANA